jgi:ABC-type amino acid transport system permease subunit
MLENLLIGLPGERPGGLALTVLYAITSGVAALVLGFAYAAIGVALPRASLPLQAANALLRGVPLLLLALLFAQAGSLTVGVAGFFALLLYSFSHVSEALRSFLATYPGSLMEQARIMGLGPVREWLGLRFPWTLRRAWGAIGTHWVSLLKDTGALLVLGIGELTTVARALGETPSGQDRWLVVLVSAAALYLAATAALVWFLRWAERRIAC